MIWIEVFRVVVMTIIGVMAGLGFVAWRWYMRDYQKLFREQDRRVTNLEAQNAVLLQMAGCPPCPHRWPGDEHEHQCMWPAMASHTVGHWCECGAQVDCPPWEFEVVPDD